MKIFITGATGFIGKNLARRLVEEGHDVISSGRSLDKLGPLSQKTRPLRLALEDKEAIQSALRRERPDVVCHAAALVESCSIKNLRRVNVEGTRNVLQACLEAGVKKVIYLSSVAVVSGNAEVLLTEDLPYKATNPYGESKLEAEKIVLDYRKKDLKIAILRPCMVYGEDEPHGLGLLIETIKRRLFPILGKGDKRLHLVSVENVVDVIIECFSKEKAYEGTYFVADREALSIKEICSYIAQVLGVKPPIVLPRFMVTILAKIPFVRRGASLFLKDRVYSIKRLREKLRYVPRVSVYEGLKRAVLAHGKRR